MRVRAHIATSVVLGGFLYLAFRSLPMAIAAFLSGVLIDLDHVLECYINFGRKFNIWKTIEKCEDCSLEKAYLFLHSYELLAIYALAVYWYQLGDIWYGIGIGVAVHMILDSIFNCYHPNGLFFFKRWKTGFNYSKIVRIEDQKKKRRVHR